MGIAEILSQLYMNDVLWVSIISSTLAQFLKPFTHKLRTGEFKWRHIAETGGMPSSHSAMVSALATGVGIEQGFQSSFFAIAVVLGLIVTYDAAGVRQQAGHHARAINLILAEMLEGNPLEKIHFDEVLGHSRIEVFAGILFGVAIMLFWKLVVQRLFG